MRRLDALRPWKPGHGDWDAAAAGHLLRRAGLGGTLEEIETAVHEGPARAVERLLGDEAVIEPALDALLSTRDPVWLQAWWIERMLGGRAPLRERVALVWHGHFATSNDKVDDVRRMHAQYETLRSHGLGDFRILLAAVLRDPAMVVWLDGDSNRAGHPNENLARELLELFALGIGHYTEKDVLETARALTGLEPRGDRVLFHRDRHDPGTKSILGQTGRWAPEDVVTLVCGHPACARHVARRLLVDFVAPAPEPDWIEELAGVLVGSGWSLEVTLRVLLGSSLFFSERARRNRISAPVECLVSAARALSARARPTALARAAGRMGQELFRPPSVEGWKGGRSWLDVGTWIARHNALVELVDAADPARMTAMAAATLWPDSAPFPTSWRAPRDVARILTSPAGQMY